MKARCPLPPLPSSPPSSPPLIPHTYPLSPTWAYCELILTMPASASMPTYLRSEREIGGREIRGGGSAADSGHHVLIKGVVRGGAAVERARAQGLDNALSSYHRLWLHQGSGGRGQGAGSVLPFRTSGCGWCSSGRPRCSERLRTAGHCGTRQNKAVHFDVHEALQYACGHVGGRRDNYR